MNRKRVGSKEARPFHGPSGAPISDPARWCQAAGSSRVGDRRSKHAVHGLAFHRPFGRMARDMEKSQIHWETIGFSDAISLLRS
jgi:hypothetical protein